MGTLGVGVGDGRGVLVGVAVWTCGATAVFVGISVTCSGLQDTSMDAINHIEQIRSNLDFFIIYYPNILTERLHLLIIIYEFEF
jgi:hypothetical protein